MICEFIKQGSRSGAGAVQSRHKAWDQEENKQIKRTIMLNAWTWKHAGSVLPFVFFFFSAADAYFITAGKHVRAECVYSFLLFVMKM